MPNSIEQMRPDTSHHRETKKSLMRKHMLNFVLAVVGLFSVSETSDPSGMAKGGFAHLEAIKRHLGKLPTSAGMQEDLKKILKKMGIENEQEVVDWIKKILGNNASFQEQVSILENIEEKTGENFDLQKLLDEYQKRREAFLRLPEIYDPEITEFVQSWHEARPEKNGRTLFIWPKRKGAATPIEEFGVSTFSIDPPEWLEKIDKYEKINPKESTEVNKALETITKDMPDSTAKGPLKTPENIETVKRSLERNPWVRPMRENCTFLMREETSEVLCSLIKELYYHDIITKNTSGAGDEHTTMGHYNGFSVDLVFFKKHKLLIPQSDGSTYEAEVAVRIDKEDSEKIISLILDILEKKYGKRLTEDHYTNEYKEDTEKKTAEHLHINLAVLVEALAAKGRELDRLATEFSKTKEARDIVEGSSGI